MTLDYRDDNVNDFVLVMNETKLHPGTWLFCLYSRGQRLYNGVHKSYIRMSLCLSLHKNTPFVEKNCQT